MVDWHVVYVELASEIWRCEVDLYDGWLVQLVDVACLEVVHLVAG